MPSQSYMSRQQELVSLGPFSGQDTFHTDPEHAVFAVGGERIPALMEAINVDLDDSGWLERRPGTTERVAFTGGKRVFSGAGLTLVQHGDGVFRFDGWNLVRVATFDSSDEVSFCEHASQVWWSNGTDYGVVASDGTNSNWGLPVPQQALLGKTSGTLPAGRYKVACTFKGSSGAESGAPVSSLITLASAGSITVGLVGAISDDASSVEVYASSADQEGLFWQTSVQPDDLPVTLTTLRSSKRPLRTQFLQGPPSNIDGVFSYMGWLMLWRDNELFRSNGISHHLFDAVHSEALPDAVVGAAGLETGFWRVTAKGAWWSTGTFPDVRTVKRDTLKYAKGQAVVSGDLIPRLQTDGLVALFFSEHGPMVGLPTGQIMRLTPDKMSVDVSSKKISIFIL